MALAYSLREHNQSWKRVRGSKQFHGGRSMQLGPFISHLYGRGSREWPESRTELSTLKPYLQHLLPPTSLHLLRVPQFSQTVAPAEIQVFKYRSSWVTFHIQNTTQGKQFYANRKSWLLVHVSQAPRDLCQGRKMTQWVKMLST